MDYISFISLRIALFFKLNWDCYFEMCFSPINKQYGFWLCFKFSDSDFSDITCSKHELMIKQLERRSNIPRGEVICLSEEQFDKIFKVNNSALDAFTINFETLKLHIFDNVSFNLFLNFFFIILLFCFVYNTNFILKNVTNLILIINKFLNFFFEIFKNLITSIRLERFFIFILSVFVFVLFQNLGGFSLLEVSFTSHIVITLFLSFIIFFNYLINYLINFNEDSYKKFVQKDLNLILILVLFLIEIVSFFVRPFSLGIRLFANILSGHILMHIFFNAFLYAYKMFFWLSIFLLIFSFFILTLEIFVSCVQAYIFFMLSVIYLQDVEKIH